MPTPAKLSIIIEYVKDFPDDPYTLIRLGITTITGKYFDAEPANSDVRSTVRFSLKQISDYMRTHGIIITDIEVDYVNA